MQKTHITLTSTMVGEGSTKKSKRTALSKSIAKEFIKKLAAKKKGGKKSDGPSKVKPSRFEPMVAFQKIMGV